MCLGKAEMYTLGAEIFLIGWKEVGMAYEEQYLMVILQCIPKPLNWAHSSARAKKEAYPEIYKGRC